MAAWQALEQGAKDSARAADTRRMTTVLDISAARSAQRQARIDTILAVCAEEFPPKDLGYEEKTGHLVTTPASWQYFERVFTAFGLELPTDVEAQAALGATMYLLGTIGDKVELRAKTPRSYESVSKTLTEPERQFLDALWSASTARVRELAGELRVLEKRPEAVEADQKLGPFKGTNLEEGMRRFATQQAALVGELKTLVAGRKNRSPIKAPSLHALRMTKRGGKTLLEVFDHMLARKPGGWDRLLAPWGLIPLHYPNIDVALDLEATGKAARILEKALGPGWRAAVAQDADALDVKYMIDDSVVSHAWAIFRHKVKDY